MTHPVSVYRQRVSGNHLPSTYSESGVSQTGQLRYRVAAGQDICVGEVSWGIPLELPKVSLLPLPRQSSISLVFL